MEERKLKNLDESEEEISEKRKTKKWKEPELKDVSEEIMAQPYIRFT